MGLLEWLGAKTGAFRKRRRAWRVSCSKSSALTWKKRSMMPTVWRQSFVSTR